jgi:MFS family permease
MRPRLILFFGNFFLSACAALTVIVMLPFLALFMSATSASIVIAAGGVVSLLGFPLLPRLVARYGAQQIALMCVLVELIALVALAAVPGPVTGSLLVIITLAMQPFAAYALDVLFEAALSSKAVAGQERTEFLTASNLGSLIAPLVLAAVLGGTNDYMRVFAAAGAILIPFLVLLAVRTLPSGTIPKPTHMGDTLVCIAKDPDLGAVTFAHFLLYLFYAWAPLYAPIYLHSVLGIPWSTLGWMFAVMVTPYILLEYPAGWLADRFVGDKKMMFVGFIFAGAGLFLLGTLSSASPLSLVLVILVGSRIGTSFIESMTEGHFFRRVSEEDVNSISVFRGIWPLANIVGPVAGSLLLSFGNYHSLFISTGAFLLIAGIVTTSLITDVR